MYCLNNWLSRLASLIILSFATQHAQSAQVDLTELSLEQLLTVEVSSASKYKQRSAEAPSAVQVISREEIQIHGWHTISEVLSSLPGIYINNDRLYDFLGARGFLIPGDYGTRFLLLIDGQRNNDNIYQQVITGNEGWLDMSVIERIEYIPGPGSAIYGSNAMFGVINVITRKAEKNPQSQVGTYVSKLGLTGVNLMTSRTFDDTGLLFQYSGEHKAGRDLTYSDPYGYLIRADGSTSPDGVAHGLDSGNNRQMMVRIDRNEWSFKLINHKRSVKPSSAAYWTVFDDPSMVITDEGTQLFASVQHELSESSNVFARLGYTDWSYLATYPLFDLPPPDGSNQGYYRNYDDVRGRILDGEFRYQLESGAHHLLGGLEFSRDLEARQHNFNSNPVMGIDVNINPLTYHAALFVQDEWRLDNALMLNLGLRLDRSTTNDSRYSPRLALVWHPTRAWTAKLLTGRAYRDANAYESKYEDGVSYLSNPGLKPETIQTSEGVLEWLGSDRIRWQLSIYENKLDNLIRQVDTTGAPLFQYQNGDSMRLQGLEMGMEKTTATDLKLRASISTSHTQSQLDNSPSWMAKAAVSAPVFDRSAYLATDARATASRSFNWYGPNSVSSEVVVNATATFPDVFTKGMQIQLRITNLFNRDIQHPAAEEMPTATVPQDGRNLLAKLEYAF